MPKLYSRKEAAEILGLAPRTVWLKLNKGEIRGAQSEKNGRWYITADALEDYLGLERGALDDHDTPTSIFLNWVKRTGLDFKPLKAYSESLDESRAKSYPKERAQKIATEELRGTLEDTLRTAKPEQYKALCQALLNNALDNIAYEEAAAALSKSVIQHRY